MPDSEDALFPKVRARVRQDADPDDLEELLPGAAPGECRAVTLPELLAALHLLDAYIPVNPGAEAMIRRLVAALVARIGGLDHGTDEAWEDTLDELLKAGRLNKAAVDAYFTTQVFDLAHPTRPFLQHPDLATECSKSATPAKLHFDRSSGNNAAWWDHTPETQPLDPLTALEGILLWRGYGPCGLGGQRKHGGTDSRNMNAAPYRSLVSYFPECRDLFLSAVLSCPPPQVWPTGPGPDRAPWECETPENPMLPVSPSGPVSLLTARTSHHILTKTEDRMVTQCWVAWGARTELPAVRDPFVLDREGKSGPVRGNHQRALLRDFDALIHATDPAVKAPAGVTPPAWIDVYAQLPLDLLQHIGPVRVRAVGYDQDKREQGDSLAYVASTPESLTACLPAYQPERARIVAIGRQDCEHAAFHLSAQLRAAWRKIDPGAKDSPWVDAARTLFWDRADTLFWTAVHTVTDPARDLSTAAVEVYDAVTADMAASPDGFLPIAEHRKWLRIGLTLRDGRIPATTTRKKAAA